MIAAALCSSIREHRSPQLNRNAGARAQIGPDTKTGAVLPLKSEAAVYEKSIVPGRNEGIRMECGNKIGPDDNGDRLRNRR